MVTMYNKSTYYSSSSAKAALPHHKPIATHATATATATTTSSAPFLHPPPPPPPPPPNESHRPQPTSASSSSIFMPARIMLAASSWLRTRRCRCLFLLLCSPLLIPFICATFPLLCAAELFIRLCGCRRRTRKPTAIAILSPHEDDGLRRCEEGCGCDGDRGVGLLQRYLEDQLLLVGSVYECGDDEDSDDRDPERNRILDCNSTCTPLLS